MHVHISYGPRYIKPVHARAKNTKKRKGKKGTKIKAFKKRKPIKHEPTKVPRNWDTTRCTCASERPVKVLRIEGQNMLVINTHTAVCLCVCVCAVVNYGTLAEPELRACI